MTLPSQQRTASHQMTSQSVASPGSHDPSNPWYTTHYAIYIKLYTYYWH